jgi:drug/metabolite transporter (DMT)-like permease
MPIVRELHQVPHSFVLSLIVDLMPMIMAVIYAIRPTERRLAFMRPLSLAAIFASLGSVIGGLAVVLRGSSTLTAFTMQAFGAIAMGLSQVLVPIYFGFGCLTVAWLLVALGMRRTRE